MTGTNTKALFGLFWVFIFIFIIIGYAFRFELQYFGYRVFAVLVPSYTLSQNGRLVIARSENGHFYLNAVINGKKIRFMVDTGASDIALTSEDALLLNFNPKTLSYKKQYNTANGVARSAPVILKTMQIGSKVLNNVSASVSQPGGLGVSLLGMSVISRFSSFKIDKDLLVLSY